MWEPLRHKPFRFLMTGRTVVHLGNAVAPIALAFAVLDLTGSVIDLGIVVAARSLANVVLLLFGGVLADRLPRALVLQGSTTLAGLTQGLVAASVLGGFASVPLLAGLSVLNGAAAAASMPATASFVPQTVPVELLRPANALARMGVTTATIVGTSAGGLLVAAVGPGWGIAFNAVTFLAASVLFGRMRLVAVSAVSVPAEERQRPLAELREGWREFTSRTWVWAVVLQFMVVNAVIVGTTVVLGPVIADATFGRAAWGLVLAAEMAGALVGGIVAARWQPRRALFAGVALTLVEAIPLVVLAEAPEVLFLVPTMFLVGMVIEQFVVAWDVALQQNVPQDKLARVYSYDALGSFVAIPVGEMAAGPLAQHFGMRATLVGGAVLLVLATLGALCSREIRTLSSDRRVMSEQGDV
ncbi:MFS transporter [Allokutzneria sp. A3M-2-11 16]|uniref:MFS transporter n=1 Tax=Allokutzneria sp. A3M-2-11 16 TaxID=2962043 RepID=UPI0020B7A124|nr:MFS transporter [Allokutzneria sp. A3M-2-11 16]MCP3801467.1 MFS transporter [Allokutzneria sp. A3M-2-11 16]